MDLRAAIAIIVAAVIEGRWGLSYHAAEEKLLELGLYQADVEHALVHAHDGVVDDDTDMKWKLYGPTLGGEVIAVVVRIRENASIRVVTVHPYP